MLEPNHPMELIINLEESTPSYFISRFSEAINSIDREGVYAAKEIQKTWHSISNQVNKAVHEIRVEASKGIEIVNEALKLNIKYDVSAYKPEGVWVKTSGNVLVIHGKQEEKDQNGRAHQVPPPEFTRKFILPKEVGSNTVSARVEDGYLIIEAPKSAIGATAKERWIAIERTDGRSTRE